MGHVYWDLYPRDHKYPYAAAFPLLKRAKVGGQVHLPAVALLCNFERAQPDRESLLYHDDVVTFFHEFAHVMHTICSTNNYIKFSGTSVEKDYVEMPSQFLENLVWEKSIL
jgi:thimet oligopeptidase